MARQEVTQYFDDIDNSPLAEEEVQVVDFTIDGVEYTMDLGPKNKQVFDEVLAPYIKAARRVSKSSSRGKSSAGSSSAVRNKLIREWALNNGLEVSKRGRIAADVVEKFNKAHQ
ncbi:histone-like nucleoid-structuring protein Lsr2 [Corynebacterium urogenitale]